MRKAWILAVVVLSGCGACGRESTEPKSYDAICHDSCGGNVYTVVHDDAGRACSLICWCPQPGLTKPVPTPVDLHGCG